MSTHGNSTTYSGPSVGEMLSTHTLASEIIARNDDTCPILDDNELQLLRSYVANPDAAPAMLESMSYVYDPQTPSSLVCFVMSLHGKGDERALSEGEIGTLRTWFEGDGGS